MEGVGKDRRDTSGPWQPEHTTAKLVAEIKVETLDRIRPQLPDPITVGNHIHIAMSNLQRAGRIVDSFLYKMLMKD